MLYLWQCLGRVKKRNISKSHVEPDKMDSTRRRALREEEIQQQLDNSDLELDPYADGSDIDDDDYVPGEHENSFARDHASDSSSSSSEEEFESSLPPPSQRGRGTVRRREHIVGYSNRSRSRTSQSSSRLFDVSSTWQEKPFTPSIIPHTSPTYLPVNTENFQKLDYFNQYIDTEIMELIVVKTNQMAIYKTGKSLNLTLAELNVLIGVIMVMGCINYPQLKMYWQRKYRVAIIADNMSRNRFFLLKNHLKVVFDPSVSPEERSKDKLWKMRPLITKIADGCQKQMKERMICVDEMIIPFTGKCGVKQYCPNKPNPVGLKAFVLANPNGIVCDFHIYQGKTTYPEYEDTDFTLGEKVVLKLTENLMPGHILYFDRYFTSEKLVLELKRRELMSAGTLPKNRIPKAARPLLLTQCQLKRLGRGSSQVLVNKETNIALTTWLDNKPVTLLSSIHANNTLDECQRWCKKQKIYVTVTRPEVVKAYNANMGGVDLADRLLSICPFRYRTIKWTQRFFAHMIDLAISNSWLQYRCDEVAKSVPIKKVQQLRAFKLELGEFLIESTHATDEENTSGESGSENSTSRKRGRQFVVPIPSEAKRRRGVAHMPVLNQKQNMCRRSGCSKKTKMACSGCNVYLCVTSSRNCYIQFHTT